MKYDKIVEISKERSKQYTKIAFGAIEEMLREGEWITTAPVSYTHLTLPTNREV